jgi:hypothetical protein
MKVQIIFCALVLSAPEARIGTDVNTQIQRRAIKSSFNEGSTPSALQRRSPKRGKGGKSGKGYGYGGKRSGKGYGYGGKGSGKGGSYGGYGDDGGYEDEGGHGDDGGHGGGNGGYGGGNGGYDYYNRGNGGNNRGWGGNYGY